MTEELYALTNAGMMGRVVWDRGRDKLLFRYESDWQDAPSNYPLSLSMPLTARDHLDGKIKPFLWGLLPDNETTLREWGKRFKVSPRNVFRLLVHVGEECAGGVQLVQQQRAEEWLKDRNIGSVTWLNESEIAERLALLVQDFGASRLGSDTGQFSLAGAQPKTGFLYDPDKHRWGVPSGRIPTSHIFKPATGAYNGLAENEHFSLALAKELGMAASESTIHQFGTTTAIVLTRYDRHRVDNSLITRIHQEDMCQASGRFPEQKYQNYGGPSAKDIISLIREHSNEWREDESRFVDALIYNWLICGTDAHAKNYSFLIASEGQVRLAPLYDLSSALPYPKQVPIRDAKLAMKIGGEYKVKLIGGRKWEKFADEVRIDFENIRSRILDLAHAVPDSATKVKARMKEEGITHEVIDKLVAELAKRAPQCISVMDNPT
jgi:serine/threonine-protein kinase HipA